MAFLKKSYLDLFKNASDSVKMMGDRGILLNSSPIISAISGVKVIVGNLFKKAAANMGAA